VIVRESSVDYELDARTIDSTMEITITDNAADLSEFLKDSLPEHHSFSARPLRNRIDVKMQALAARTHPASCHPIKNYNEANEANILKIIVAKHIIQRAVIKHENAQ